MDNELVVAAMQVLEGLKGVANDSHANLYCQVHGGADEDQMRAFLTAGVRLGLEINAHDSAYSHGDSRWISFDEPGSQRKREQNIYHTTLLTLFVGQTGSVWNEQVQDEIAAIRVGA